MTKNAPETKISVSKNLTQVPVNWGRLKKTPPIITNSPGRKNEENITDASQSLPVEIEYPKKGEANNTGNNASPTIVRVPHFPFNHKLPEFLVRIKATDR